MLNDGSERLQTDPWSGQLDPNDHLKGSFLVTYRFTNFWGPQMVAIHWDDFDIARERRTDQRDAVWHAGGQRPILDRSAARRASSASGFSLHRHERRPRHDHRLCLDSHWSLPVSC